MKRLCIPGFVYYILYLFMINFFAVSCINQEKENDDSTFKTKTNKTDSITDFDLIDGLNKSNKIIIELSNIALKQTKDVKTLNLLLKIKTNQQKIESDLRKLTEKNLMFIPKIIYNLNLNPIFLKGKNSNSYLLKLLETEQNKQLLVLDQIKKTAQSIDLKILSIQLKKRIQDTNDSLASL